MARALWSGSISFGLLNIPVQLMPAERRTDLRFHLMDARNKARVRYERINEETGEEVPWKDIVKAFEYKKGDYVVLEKEDLSAATPHGSQSVDIESFIPADAVAVEYFERPYYLVPPRKAEKGYALLRATLKELGRVGLARVVIRTREYLALVMPRDAALMLMLLRYPQELVPADEYAFPDRPLSAYRVSKPELAMARQLVESMSGEWRPSEHRDEFRAKLSEAIEQRMRQRGARVAKPQAEKSAGQADNVVDLMATLRRSLEAAGAKRAAHAPSAHKQHHTSRHHQRKRA
ncbi:MAG: Ku protein [Gammaproteobacteria bacterium]|nr:Ku protein [Gammaproteobacteria bacterium]